MKAILHTFLGFLWPFLIGIGIGVTIVLSYDHPAFFKTTFLSPLGINPEITSTRIPSAKPIIGFLPYWTMNDADIKYHLLDYIAYFDVKLDGSGNIIKETGQREIDMGWYKLQSDQLETVFETAKKQNVGRMVVFTAFDNIIIDSLISNPQAKETAIANITDVVKKYDLEGVNIDFEYNGGASVKPAYGYLYPEFLKDLRKSLDAAKPGVIITADIYGNGFISDKPYQSAPLAEAVDYLVLMGYDFHQASSRNAGPIAPLKSQNQPSITLSLQKGLDKGIKPEKIILAMPFYGYEWQTTSDEYGAATRSGTGTMASYQRVHSLIKKEGIKPQWDFDAMAPWIAYRKNNVTRQIYYENDESLALKFQLIDQVNLGGGAIWALGYEGKDASIWNVIEDWRRKEQ